MRWPLYKTWPDRWRSCAVACDVKKHCRYFFTYYLLSRWRELNSRPTPSLTPSFQYIEGLDCILIATSDSLVSRSGDFFATVLSFFKDINRYSGCDFDIAVEKGGALAAHHGVALPLSYIGLKGHPVKLAIL